jgi:hypothetical protein
VNIGRPVRWTFSGALCHAVQGLPGCPHLDVTKSTRECDIL